jgi:hypothetical protein
MSLYLTASLAAVLRKEKKIYSLSGAGGEEATVGMGQVSVPISYATRYSAQADDYVPMSSAYGKAGREFFNLNVKGVTEVLPPTEDGPCFYFSEEDSEEIFSMNTYGAWLAEH